MRIRRATLVIALSLTACGARTDIPDGEEIDGSVVQDTGAHDSTVQDSPPVDDVTIDVPVVDVPVVDTGPSCIQSCTHNHQCEATCPPLQSGRWCCDEQVGTCYAFAGKFCPPQIIDAGFD